MAFSYDDFQQGYDAITKANKPGSEQSPSLPVEGATPVELAKPAETPGLIASPDPAIEQVYQEQQQRIAQENLQNRGEVTRGLLRGIDQLQGSLYGMAGLAGSAIGSERMKRWGLEGYARNEEEAALNPSAVPNFTDIKGPVDAYKYAAGKFGELLPSVAEGIVGAAVGALAGSAVEPGGGTVAGAAAGLAGRTLLKKSVAKIAEEMVAKNVEGLIAKGVTREVAESLATTAAAKKLVEHEATKLALRSAGGAAGVVGGTFPLEAGGNYAENMERGIDAPWSAAATGLGSAFLELAGGNYRTISKIVGPEKTALFKKALAKADTSLLGSIIKEAAIQAPEEFAQEAGQEMLSMANVAINDPTFEVFSKENASRAFEAGMAGAVGGAAFGAMGGAHSKLVAKVQAAALQKKIDNLSSIPEDQRTEAQKINLDKYRRLALPLPERGEWTGPTGTEFTRAGEHERYSPDFAETLKANAEAKGLPPGQGFTYYNVPALDRFSPELADALTKHKLLLPEGEGFILRGDAENVLNQYSPELASAFKEQKDKALPEGQGFEVGYGPYPGQAEMGAPQLPHADFLVGSPFTPPEKPFKSMNSDELRGWASQNGIKIPGSVKNTSTVLRILTDAIQPKGWPPIVTEQGAARPVQQGGSDIVEISKRMTNLEQLRDQYQARFDKMQDGNAKTKIGKEINRISGLIDAHGQDLASKTGTNPTEIVQAPIVQEMDQGAHGAATSPTNNAPEPSQAQKEAGNYKVGRIKLHGMDVSVENPAGSTRKGVDADGKPWKTKMQDHYGYIRGTVGKDKDHLDVFVGRSPESERVFVVDQINPKTSQFDEHKVIMGANSIDEAKQIYHRNYNAGWQGMGAITEMPMSEFKEWSKDREKTKKPVAYEESWNAGKPSEKLSDQWSRTPGEMFAGRGKRAEIVDKLTAADTEKKRKRLTSELKTLNANPSENRERLGQIRDQLKGLKKGANAPAILKKYHKDLDAQRDNFYREAGSRINDLVQTGVIPEDRREQFMSDFLERTRLPLTRELTGAVLKHKDKTYQQIFHELVNEHKTVSTEGINDRQSQGGMAGAVGGRQEEPGGTVQDRGPGAGAPPTGRVLQGEEGGQGEVTPARGPRMSSDLEAAMTAAVASVDKIEQKTEPGAVSSPKEIASEKAHVKGVLLREIKAGSIPVGHAVRATDIEELKHIIQKKALKEGQSFEGRPGISATQITTRDNPVIPMYGGYEHIPVGVIAPREAIIGRGESVNEVLLDPKFDVTKLGFAIDKHDEVYSFKDLPGVLKEIEGQGKSAVTERRDRTPAEVHRERTARAEKEAPNVEAWRQAETQRLKKEYATLKGKDAKERRDEIKQQLQSIKYATSPEHQALRNASYEAERNYIEDIKQEAARLGVTEDQLSDFSRDYEHRIDPESPEGAHFKDKTHRQIFDDMVADYKAGTPKKGIHDISKIVEVRGRKVRIEPDGSLHAVEPGYFPVSDTGYHSMMRQESTPEALEKLAKEQDTSRRSEIGRAQKALSEKKSASSDPVYHLIQLEGAMDQMAQNSILAPEADQKKMFELGRALAEKISALEVPKEAQGRWTPENFRESIETAKARAKDFDQALKGDLSGLMEGRGQRGRFGPMVPSHIKEFHRKGGKVEAKAPAETSPVTQPAAVGVSDKPGPGLLEGTKDVKYYKDITDVDIKGLNNRKAAELLRDLGARLDDEGGIRHPGYILEARGMGGVRSAKEALRQIQDAQLRQVESAKYDKLSDAEKEVAVAKAYIEKAAPDTTENGKTLVIATCVSKKIWEEDRTAGAVRASEAYTSDYFKKMKAYAEKHGDEWKILSAKYGLIYPELHITPYNVRFGQEDAAKLSEIAKTSVGHKVGQYSKIILLGGEEYRSRMKTILDMMGVGNRVEEPFKGMGIGDQMKAMGAAATGGKLDFDPYDLLTLSDKEFAEKHPEAAARMQESANADQKKRSEVEGIITGLKSTIEDLKAKRADWVGRQYKENAGTVTVGGKDEFDPDAKYRIDTVNEKRRQRNVKALERDITALSAWVQKLQGDIDSGTYQKERYKPERPERGWEFPSGIAPESVKVDFEKSAPAAPAAKVAETATSTFNGKPLSETEVSLLQDAINELQSSEGPALVNTPDGKYHRLKSGNPDWFKEWGITKDRVFTALQKAIDGKILTDNQKALVKYVVQAKADAMGEQHGQDFWNSISGEDHAIINAKEKADVVLPDMQGRSQADLQEDQRRLDAQRAGVFKRTKVAEWDLKAFEPRTEEERLAQEVGKRLGVKVVYWESKVPFYNGLEAWAAHPSQQERSIFINGNNAQPLLLILGHELFHTLQNTRPELYESFKQLLRNDIVAFDDYVNKINKNYLAGGLDPLSKEEVLDEFFADFAGDQFGEKSFWREVAAKNPTIAERVMLALHRLIDKVMGWYKGRMLESETHFKDLVKAQRALADVISEFAQGAAKEDAAAKAAKAWNDSTIPFKLKDLEKSERKAFDSQIKKTRDGSEVLSRVKRLEGTPWERTAVKGVIDREALDHLLSGNAPGFLSDFSAPSMKKFSEAIREKGDGPIWMYLARGSSREGIIGSPEKPKNSINGSFVDCDPSPGCAHTCYAATGRNFPMNMVRSELVAWAIRTDPLRAAKLAASAYKSMLEFQHGKALRMFDKGDGGPEYLPFIKALNDEGIRLQIFSKLPDFLRQVPDFNLRLLSIDSTNLKKALQNPGLPIAFLYEGDGKSLAAYRKLADRVHVILPVKIKDRMLDPSEMVRLKQLFPGVDKKLCPVDSGVKSLKNGWNCTACDVDDGLPGCFFGQSTEKVSFANTPLTTARISSKIKELQQFAEGLSDAHRKQFVQELHLLVSQVRGGIDPGTARAGEVEPVGAPLRADKNAAPGTGTGANESTGLAPDFEGKVRFSVRRIDEAQEGHRPIQRRLELQGQQRIAFPKKAKGGEVRPAERGSGGTPALREPGPVQSRQISSVKDFAQVLKFHSQQMATDNWLDPALRPEMRLTGDKSAVIVDVPSGTSHSLYEYNVSAKPEDVGKIGDWIDKIKHTWRSARKYLSEADANEFLGAKGTQFSVAPSEKKGPIFYSQLERTLSSKLPNMGQVKDFANMVNSWAKKGEFKSEELQWSGLQEWLADKQGKISKQEVLDYLKQNEVQIKEVEKGASLSESKNDWQKVSSDVWIWRTEGGPVRAKITYDGEGYEAWSGSDVGGTDWFATLEEAKEALSFETVPTKYNQYTQPGGENYRELLLTLPPKTEEQLSRRIIPGKEKEYEHFKTLAEGYHTQVTDMTLTKGERFRHEFNRGEMERQMHALTEPVGRTQERYESPHWNEPNVLAHVRFDDRDGPNGEKLLHIAEVQSDWHQAGRKKGYKGSDKEQIRKFEQEFERLGQERDALDEELKLHQADMSYDTTAGIDKYNDMVLEMNYIRRQINQLQRVGVANAPFKTTWPLLAMKRMIRYAAEHGYDGISWDPGAVQAERYDLSKEVDSLLVWGDKKGGYYYEAKKDGRVLNADNGTSLSAEKLAETIGKDLSEKAIKDIDAGKRAEYSGIDLKVGGEGMKGFYDRILPAEMNKYTKKWGARVGETTIPTEGYEFQALNADGESYGVFSTQMTAETVLREMGVPRNQWKIVPHRIQSATDTVHFLPVTGAMRESVMQGQTQFALKPTPQQLRDYPLMSEASGAEKQQNFEQWSEEGERGVQFSLRPNYEPGKTITAYKLFRTMKTRPGELFPLFIGRTEPTPMGKWIEAKFIPTAGFAERPGWHIGTSPSAPHLMKQDGTMKEGRVWAEVEIPADVDWQQAADQQPSQDIRGQVPEGGYYRFKRPVYQGGEWLIAGAMKVNKILSDAEVSKILAEQPPEDRGVQFRLKDAGQDEFFATGKAIRDSAKGLDETGFLGRIFVTAEHWKHAVGRAIFEAAQGKSEDRHQIMNNVLKIPELVDKIKEIMFQGKSWLDRQRGYDYYDQSNAPKEYQDFGHHIDYMDRMNWKWKAEKDKDGNPVYQKDADGTEMEPYRDRLIRQGVPKAVIEVIDKFRDMNDAALELQRADIKELLDKYEKEGKPVPVVGTTKDADGKPHEITLKDLYNQMGWLKGSYAPRIREPGDWAITSKKGGDRYRYHQPSRRAAYKLIEHLKREGHTDLSEPTRVERLPESIYQAISIPDIQSAVDKAIRGADLDQETAARLRQSVLENAADLLKERGFRSHKIQRSEGPVIKGYITDPMTRGLMYAQQTAGGIAKSKAASKMFSALMGQWNEYTREGNNWVRKDKDGNVINTTPLTTKEIASDKEKKSFHEGGVRPEKEPERFDTYSNYIHEMLRNPDATDRAIAFGKSLVSFKYLGFSPRTILANVTALVTTVPGAIHQYAMEGKGSLLKIGAALTKATKDFGRVMAGKQLENADEQKFMAEIMGSADLEQYTREAMSNLAGAYGKSWQAIMQKSMWGFGKSEEWIRGSTMLAAYRLAREGGKTHDEAGKMAKDASNKAHGIYSEATQPLWTMGSNPAAKIGRMGVTYLKFAHNYLQTLYDLGMNKRNTKAFTFALLSPAVLAGSSAMVTTPILLAFGKALMRALGDDRDPEKMVYDTIRENLGESTEKFARFGLLGLAGADISGSLAIGMEPPRTLLDLTGPFGGVAQDVGKAAHYLSTGQPGKAAERVVPTFASNLMRSIRELNGATTSDGNRVWDEQGRPYIPTGGETVGRAMGFRSGRRATVEAHQRESKRELADFSDHRRNIFEEYRAYAASPDHDPEKLQSIMDEVASYNQFVRDHELKKIVPLITRDSLRGQAHKMTRPDKGKMAIIRSYQEEEQ